MDSFLGIVGIFIELIDFLAKYHKSDFGDCKKMDFFLEFLKKKSYEPEKSERIQCLDGEVMIMASWG